MVDNLDKWVQLCIEEVRSNSDYNLSFVTRRRLLEAFDSVFSGNFSGPIEMTRAHFVRANLAILCAKKVLPIWERNITASHPQRILQECEAYIEGHFGLDELQEDIQGFTVGLMNASSDEELVAYPAGRAAHTAAIVVVCDEIAVDPEIDEDEKNDPQDPDHFDSAYWAAVAYAGGDPSHPGFDKKRNGEFWEWYLNEAVPAACESVE